MTVGCSTLPPKRLLVFQLRRKGGIAMLCLNTFERRQTRHKRMGSPSAHQWTKSGNCGRSLVALRLAETSYFFFGMIFSRSAARIFLIWFLAWIDHGPMVSSRA